MAITGTPAAGAADSLGALEALWHARRPPPHWGGRPKATPPFLCDQSVRASKFFADRK